MQIGIHSDSSCSTTILRTHEFVNTRSEFCQVAPQYPVSVFGDLHNLCCCFGWPSQLVLLYHLPHHCWAKSPLPPESTTNLLFFRSFYTYLSSSSFFICVWKSNKVKTRNCRGPCTSSDLWEWTITVTISDARSLQKWRQSDMILVGSRLSFGCQHISKASGWSNTNFAHLDCHPFRRNDSFNLNIQFESDPKFWHNLLKNKKIRFAVSKICIFNSNKYLLFAGHTLTKSWIPLFFLSNTEPGKLVYTYI